MEDEKNVTITIEVTKEYLMTTPIDKLEKDLHKKVLKAILKAVDKIVDKNGKGI